MRFTYHLTHPPRARQQSMRRRWRRMDLLPILLGFLAASLLVILLWRMEFALTSGLALAIVFIAMLLAGVRVIAAAILHLFGDWRRGISLLACVAVWLVVIAAGVSAPVSIRFSAARWHYEESVVFTGSNPGVREWPLDAQLDGSDETDLVYDEWDSDAPRPNEPFHVERRGECTITTEHITGHFYRRDFDC